MATARAMARAMSATAARLNAKGKRRGRRARRRVIGAAMRRTADAAVVKRLAVAGAVICILSTSA